EGDEEEEDAAVVGDTDVETPVFVVWMLIFLWAMPWIFNAPACAHGL
ncbi:hypothetical protein A2U01_0054083, partial [Trifolium medium]|nr:hypothetical protein [Trifolium medium]